MRVCLLFAIFTHQALAFCMRPSEFWSKYAPVLNISSLNEALQNPELIKASENKIDENRTAYTRFYANGDYYLDVYMHKRGTKALLSRSFLKRVREAKIMAHLQSSSGPQSFLKFFACTRDDESIIFLYKGDTQPLSSVATTLLSEDEGARFGLYLSLARAYRFLESKNVTHNNFNVEHIQIAGEDLSRPVLDQLGFSFTSDQGTPPRNSEAVISLSKPWWWFFESRIPESWAFLAFMAATEQLARVQSAARESRDMTAAEFLSAFKEKQRPQLISDYCSHREELFAALREYLCRELKLPTADIPPFETIYQNLERIKMWIHHRPKTVLISPL